jgi:hypothetical protein
MTRLFTDGAEMGDIMFWDWYDGDGNLVAVDTPTPIGGTYSYRGCWLGAHKLIGSNISEFYMRYRLRTDNNVQAVGSDMLAWRNGMHMVGRVTVDSLKRFTIEFSDHSTVSSLGMLNDTWYLIEVHISLDGTVGRAELFIDGTQYIDYTGDTDPDGYLTVDNIYFNTNVYTDVYIDDLALNDVNGIIDNSWCGDGIIVKMTPNGNGDDNDWTNSDGDSIDNYLYVDEFPNDGDLTYVYCDGSSSGTQDQYNLTDLNYTNKTVLRIYPEARARKTASSGYTLKLGILPSGGADTLSAGRALFTDYYSRVIGDEYTENPFDSSPWDELSLDPLQFIAEVG